MQSKRNTDTECNAQETGKHIAVKNQHENILHGRTNKQQKHKDDNMKQNKKRCRNLKT